MGWLQVALGGLIGGTLVPGLSRPLGWSRSPA